MLELPAVADEGGLFEDGHPMSRPSPPIHHGLGLANAVTWRVSASVGNLCGMSPKVLWNLSDPLVLLWEIAGCEYPGTRARRCPARLGGASWSAYQRPGYSTPSRSCRVS